jgi:hypothetical protein
MKNKSLMINSIAFEPLRRYAIAPLTLISLTSMTLSCKTEVKKPNIVIIYADDL